MAESEIPQDVIALVRETISLHFHDTAARNQREWDQHVEIAARAIMADRAAREPDRDMLVEALLEIAVEEFEGSNGISIYAAATNELRRRTKIARAALSAIEAAT